MFYPPEKLQYEIQSQQTAVWLFSDFKKMQSAILAKLPSVAIKAIAQGAKVDLTIAMTEPEHCYYSVALKVHDSEDSPFIALSPLRDVNAINSALSLTTSNQYFITLIDEYDNLVCHGTFEVSHEFKSEIRQAFSKVINPYEVHDIEIVNDVLDSLSHHLYPHIYPEGIHQITSVTHHIPINNIVNVMILDYEHHSTAAYKIDAGKEGIVQEKLLAHKLSILFHGNVHHSPDKTRDTQKREFVDIFVTSNTYNLLISSKAMSLYESDYKKSMQRRISTLTSHAEKAFVQVHGAVKSIRRGEKITKFESDDVIYFDRTLPVHAIAIISEFIPDNEAWNECVNFARNIYEETGTFVHLFDPHEFIYLLKLADGSQERLDFMLRRIFQTFYEHKTFNIKSTDSSLPMNYAPD